MKTIFTLTSLIIGLAVFVPYYINIKKGTARPHLFSWLTWGIVNGLGFILSFARGGGGGAWLFALSSILCFGIAVYAFLKGEKNIVFIDWLAFIGALAAIAIYAFTENAVASVSLAAAIDFLGLFPTFRKSYDRPHDEPMLTYAFSGLAFLFSVFALQAYNFVTVFYPLTIAIVNLIFILFVLARRKGVPAAAS